MILLLVILNIAVIATALVFINRYRLELISAYDTAERAVAVAKDYRTAYEGRVKMTSRPNHLWTWLVLIFCAAMLWIIFRRAQRSE